MDCKRVKVYGLQRSGTKYLQALITANFKIVVEASGDCRLGWKHAMPGERWPMLPRHHKGLRTQHSIKELLAENFGAMAILLRKRRNQWVASINRRPTDIVFYRPHLSGMKPKQNNLADYRPCLYPRPKTGQLTKFHDEYHHQWEPLVQAGRVVLVEYLDLLADFIQTLEGLEQRFSLVRRHPKLRDVRVVGENESAFTPERRRHYLKDY